MLQKKKSNAMMKKTVSKRTKAIKSTTAKPKVTRTNKENKIKAKNDETKQIKTLTSDSDIVIHSFDDITCKSSISNGLFTSIEGIDSVTKLETVNAPNSLLVNFKFSGQKAFGVENLDISNSPICNNPWAELMAQIVFDNKLVTFNQKPIRKSFVELIQSQSVQNVDVLKKFIKNGGILRKDITPDYIEKIKAFSSIFSENKGKLISFWESRKRLPLTDYIDSEIKNSRVNHNTSTNTESIFRRSSGEDTYQKIIKGRQFFYKKSIEKKENPPEQNNYKTSTQSIILTNHDTSKASAILQKIEKYNMARSGIISFQISDLMLSINNESIREQEKEPYDLVK